MSGDRGSDAARTPRARPVLRAGAVLLAALVGLVCALAGLIVHRHALGALPWGLALALATALLVTLAAGELGGRTAALAVAAAYALLLLVATGQRGEGDYLIASDLLGYAYLLGGLVAVGIGVALAGRSGSAARRTAD
ncbi:hypothetical protein CLV56_0941 [Mumia flava]|uniref:Uncharacterized protein n=1 Tax=Mumia flava TaxID=1348852 RepID=A0A2M9BFK2_9ACTN|nr:DUF6113 family protein [Mumia flava]PJJ56730.1 hypothetical protein CLV56_0941 [Mumia flava]